MGGKARDGRILVLCVCVFGEREEYELLKLEGGSENVWLSAT